MPPSIRRHLTFSNVVAFIALALALGGVSYAAVTLPDRSVGRRQLQGHAVTAGKLATRSVKRRALSRGIRKKLAKKGGSGAAGQQGPAGPGAGRLHYFDTASGTPTTKPVLDFGGLKLIASCDLSGPTTTIAMSGTSDTDALFRVNFNVDNGTDPTMAGPVTGGNIQVDLPAGVETSLGGLGADTPNFFARAIATVVYTTQGRVITLTISQFVDGGAGTCAIDGTAVTAS